MTDTRRVTPWYRQPWPWLLMIAPASALVGGFFTWWLAATTNNSLVVDDYYREGRAINQQLARDERAARLELEATLDSSHGISLVLHGRLGNDWPDTLSLRLVHATEATLDSALMLKHEGDGRYRGPGVLPAAGRWIVHLEDPQRDWRLMARAERFDQPLALRADPVAAGGGQ
jgi:hypothetical protein